MKLQLWKDISAYIGVWKTIHELHGIYPPVVKLWIDLHRRIKLNLNDFIYEAYGKRQLFRTN